MQLEDPRKGKELFERLDAIMVLSFPEGREEFCALLSSLLPDICGDSRDVVRRWLRNQSRDGSVGDSVGRWMGSQRLDRLERDARAGHANPAQMLNLIGEVRRRRGLES
jgi:hypothetical protein